MTTSADAPPARLVSPAMGGRSKSDRGDRSRIRPGGTFAMEALDPTAVGGRHIADAVPECRIAVLIPCYNEEVTIAQVVHGFRCALPSAEIYVYDNNSTDETVARAKEAGAIVRREPLQGKGTVVRSLFADIEADVYDLVDGDETYDAARAPTLVATLLAGLIAKAHI